MLLYFYYSISSHREYSIFDDKIIEEKNNTKNDYLQIQLVLKECVSSGYEYSYAPAKIVPSDVLCGAN